MVWSSLMYPKSTCRVTSCGALRWRGGWAVQCVLARVDTVKRHIYLIFGANLPTLCYVTLLDIPSLNWSSCYWQLLYNTYYIVVFNCCLITNVAIPHILQYIMMRTSERDNLPIGDKRDIPFFRGCTLYLSVMDTLCSMLLSSTGSLGSLTTTQMWPTWDAVEGNGCWARPGVCLSSVTSSLRSRITSSPTLLVIASQVVHHCSPHTSLLTPPLNRNSLGIGFKT